VWASGTPRMSRCGRWMPSATVPTRRSGRVWYPRPSSPRSRLASRDQSKIARNRIYAGRRTACGTRTHALRITRTPPRRPHRSTSTDRTSHDSRDTQRPGATPFVMQEVMPDPAALVGPRQEHRSPDDARRGAPWMPTSWPPDAAALPRRPLPGARVTPEPARTEAKGSRQHVHEWLKADTFRTGLLGDADSSSVAAGSAHPAPRGGQGMRGSRSP
jgi:hypothetical protein